MLEIRDVHVYYRKIHALKGLNISVKPGEIVTLIGSNGAGKSTLLKTIFNMPQSQQGSIEFTGHDITRLAPHEIAPLGIAIVPEGRRIFPRMSVRENLDLGGTVAPKSEHRSSLEYVLDMFPRLRERIGQNGGTLSGGEQQMLAIGRALMSRPKLLLLDEPSLGLAPIIIQQIFKTIKNLNESGMTILLVEQNANQALRLAHRGYVMVGGAITMQGSGQDLLENPSVRAAYLAG